MKIKEDLYKENWVTFHKKCNFAFVKIFRGTLVIATSAVVVESDHQFWA